MKKLLMLLLCLCSSITFAQKKEEIKELFWGKNDKYKSVTSIPDKWKNESAVVIYKYEDYDYHKFGMNVTYTAAIRKRVKLLDQAAVTEFSEFSFKDRFYSTKGWGGFKKGTNIIGIKVVKPDGTEKEINIDEEAVTTDDVKKIAIPNLEIGDIIDYYFYSVEPFKSVGAFGFDAVEETLGDVYPTMNLKLTFKTENDFFVNFNTYNGAPELKQVSAKGDSPREYELVATDIEKNDFPRWFLPLVELPCYKFQVFFARNGNFEEQAAAFLPEKESIIKKTVTQQEILDEYDKMGPFGDIREVEKYIKNKSFASEEEKVKEVYYYMRHQYYTRYVEAFVVNEAKIMNPFELYGNYPIFIDNDAQFIRFFTAFLKENKITYNIIISTPRYNGPIKDLLIKENVKILLRVNTKNPIYLELYSPYNNADQIDYTVENTEAYALKSSKGKKIDGIEPIKLPVSTYKDNIIKETIQVSLNDDFSALNVNRETSQYGHSKDYDQKDKLGFFDYVAEDYAKYGTTPLMELVRNKKKQEQYTKEFEALKNKLKDKQKEEFKASAESEFGFSIDDHSLEIVNTGRYSKEDPFSVKEKFIIKDNLIKKAGQNYVLELSKLIGEQIEINEKETKRTNNIYSIYPRSYDEEIVFTIPDGYTIAGLDKLNKKVENPTGGFISSATVEGNKLTIKTQKYYSNYFEPNANWKNMVAFLDAAYQFTQEKVLLKKS